MIRRSLKFHAVLWCLKTQKMPKKLHSFRLLKFVKICHCSKLWKIRKMRCCITLSLVRRRRHEFVNAAVDETLWQFAPFFYIACFSCRPSYNLSTSMVDLLRGRWKWRTWKCRTRFRCLNRSDDTEHCRMHGIVSETFDISWYSYTWYFRWYLI